MLFHPLRCQTKLVKRAKSDFDCSFEPGRNMSLQKSCRCNHGVPFSRSGSGGQRGSCSPSWKIQAVPTAPASPPRTAMNQPHPQPPSSRKTSHSRSLVPSPWPTLGSLRGHLGQNAARREENSNGTMQRLNLLLKFCLLRTQKTNYGDPGRNRGEGQMRSFRFADTHYYI